MQGIELESVGTFLRDDGMTFTMNADGSFNEADGVHISDIESDGEWANTLSKYDRALVLWNSSLIRHREAKTKHEVN